MGNFHAQTVVLDLSHQPIFTYAQGNPHMCVGNPHVHICADGLALPGPKAMWHICSSAESGKGGSGLRTSSYLGS